jgi:hypothetical protein
MFLDVLLVPRVECLAARKERYLVRGVRRVYRSGDRLEPSASQGAEFCSDRVTRIRRCPAEPSVRVSRELRESAKRRAADRPGREPEPGKRS